MNDHDTTNIAHFKDELENYLRSNMIPINLSITIHSSYSRVSYMVHLLILFCCFLITEFILTQYSDDKFMK